MALTYNININPKLPNSLKSSAIDSPKYVNNISGIIEYNEINTVEYIIMKCLFLNSKHITYSNNLLDNESTFAS